MKVCAYADSVQNVPVRSSAWRGEMTVRLQLLGSATVECEGESFALPFERRTQNDPEFISYTDHR